MLSLTIQYEALQGDVYLNHTFVNINYGPEVAVSSLLQRSTSEIMLSECYAPIATCHAG
jgi:hypothetical protein